MSFVEERYGSYFCKLDVITKGTYPEIITNIIFDEDLVLYFLNGLSGI